MVRLLLHDGLCGVGLGLILAENAEATLQTNDVTRDIKMGPIDSGVLPTELGFY